MYFLPYKNHLHHNKLYIKTNNQMSNSSEKITVNTLDTPPPFEYNSEKLPAVSMFKMFFTLMPKKEIFLFLLAALGSIGSAITLQLRDYYIGRALTKLTSSNDTNIIDKGIKDICIYFGIICALSLLFNYLMMGLFGYLSKSLATRYKIEYHNLVIGMNQTWFDRMGKSPFELGNQMILELTSIESALGQIIGNLINEASSLLFGVIFGLVINWKMTLILMTLYPVWIAIQFFSLISIGDVFMRKAILLGRLGGYLEEILYKIKTVASFANFDYERKSFNKEIDHVLANSKSL